MESPCYWQSLTIQQREASVGPQHESRCCSRYAWDIQGILQEDWEKKFKPQIDTLIETNHSEIHPRGGLYPALAIDLYLLSAGREIRSIQPALVIRSGSKSAAQRAKRLLKQHPLYQKLNTGFDIRIPKMSMIFFRTGDNKSTEDHHSSKLPEALFGVSVSLTTLPISESSSWTRATAGIVWPFDGDHYIMLPWHSCFPEDYFSTSNPHAEDIHDQCSWSDSDEDEASAPESDTEPEEGQLLTPEQSIDVSTAKHGTRFDIAGHVNANWDLSPDVRLIVQTDKCSVVGHIQGQAEAHRPESSVRTTFSQLDCVLVKIDGSPFIVDNKLATPDGTILTIDTTNICREVPSSPVFIAAGVSGVCKGTMRRSTSSILFPWSRAPQKVWTMDFTLASGDSGAFVIDHQGRPVGMAVASVPSAKLTYIIPAEDLLRAALPGWPKETLTGSTLISRSQLIRQRSIEINSSMGLAESSTASVPIFSQSRAPDAAMKQSRQLAKVQEPYLPKSHPGMDQRFSDRVSKNAQTLNISGLSHLREDEWEIDFNDSRAFLIEQFNNANSLWPLSNADREQSSHYTDHISFSEFVYREKTNAQRANQVMKSTALLGLTQFDKWLWKFDDLVQELVCDIPDDIDQGFFEDRSIDTSNLWRLAYLNVKLCVDSDVKLKATQRWMKELQRNLELLVNSIRGQLDNKTNEINNIRTELTETFEPIISLLKTSVDYLQRNYEDRDFLADWSSGMEPRRAETYESMVATVRHLRDVTNNNRASETRYAAEGLRLRTEQMDGGESAIFPLETLPPLRADHFTGREKDLENIHEWLGLQESPAIRTYTIYGRRGIGKTQIALEYARKHRRHYDAVFWIQAETKGSLRQSFTDIAVALELHGADKNATFDENLVRVMRWLRHTQKRWLLIYDNAERARLLKGYWPSGGHGAMLLTSRSYYNFFEDDQRHGETVQLFNEVERRQLFLSCLGEDWQSTHLNPEDMMVDIEDAAMFALLKKTGGLPIAIRHAATIILDFEINPRRTIRAFMEMFSDSYQDLPRRQMAERDPLVRVLDTIWNISFSNLQAPAKNILSGLSLLAPDKVLIDLFLPSDQTMLTKSLEFCRSTAYNTDLVKSGPGTSLQTVINPSPDLLEAIDELFHKNLIKRTGREISMHRTVQEAVHYQGENELSDFFDAMVSLLYDAFPKQSQGRPLTEYWEDCQIWIQHIVTLALKYKAYTSNRPGADVPLKGMASADLFVKLLANAAWYLFEIADYEEALNLVEIARSAAQDKESLDYAQLLNTAGVIYYELNNLRRARDATEQCLAIRSRVLPEDDVEIANILSNLGNVETAEGNLEAAMEFLERSAAIREAIGDDAAMMLAMNYIQIGRVHFLQEDFPQAYFMYQKCERVLNMKAGRNKLFTANLQYAYGNLEFAQQQFDQAARSYDLTRQIAKDFNPMHPLAAAACYKLACAAFEQDHHKKALNYLSKALDIAELRGVSEDDGLDGTVVRILFKRAEILLDDPLGDFNEGSALMNDMLFRQKDVAEKLELDLRGLEMLEDRGPSFDLLVPGYFR